MMISRIRAPMEIYMWFFLPPLFVASPLPNAKRFVFNRSGAVLLCKVFSLRPSF